MDSLKLRAETIPQLIDNLLFYCFDRPLTYTDKARKLLDDEAKVRLSGVRVKLADMEGWAQDTLETTVKSFAEETGEKLGKIAQPLRAALTGTNVSPGIFEVAAVLGKDEALGRIDDAIANA